ncbi:hypothetical protein HELRODRAFT_77755, partial [Helobdella robusta]|uniref:Uncharacterized protein n=1 Tax=Helobdella robusta TaxID=6412 RepID=T1G335_HELRO
RFRSVLVKEKLQETLVDFFKSKVYKSEDCAEWTKSLCNNVKDMLKSMGFPRYKFIVQAVIGEMRGQGVKMCCRTFWDSDTDSYVQETFVNNSLFCVVVCYGVYYY